ncbi:MAG TPA: META domain-containing protein [Burkholderiales bacterium]|nr:META domain-containing protein [Burkholderiales bacterium]
MLVLLASLAALSSCAGVDGPAGAGAREQTGALAIKGLLSYRARIALPPDSRAIVALKDVSRPDGAVVAEQRIDLHGRQVPIAFELVVDRAKLDEAKRYAVRGAVFASGRPVWASEPVMIDRTTSAVDVGTLDMTPIRAGAFATVFQCGSDRATVGFTQHAMQLTVGSSTFEMRQAVAASGARYEAVGDPTTSFWNKGRRATLVVKGQTFPECVQVDDASHTFRARGNEPGWRLDIDGERMMLVTQSGEKRLAPTPAAQRTNAFTRYATRTEGSDVTATIFNRACKDTMTGMPHPHAVEVVLDGKKLTGCGGDPAALLQGREWVVEDINSKGIIDRSRATLNFGPDGRVSGRSSCNNYTAQYSLTGEGLAVSKAAGTMMACEPALMQQESLFLDVLQNVRRFDLGPDGALVLQTDDRRTITARR